MLYEKPVARCCFILLYQLANCIYIYTNGIREKLCLDTRSWKSNFASEVVWALISLYLCVCGLSLFAVYGYHLKINANATASVIFMKTPHIA